MSTSKTSNKKQISETKSYITLNNKSSHCHELGSQEVGKRQKWDKSHEFVFAVAGCAIGLGNVWRFPYLCYSNGGGSFVFAYLFFIFAVGVPAMLLEVTMGQFMSRAGIEVWNMVPIAKGIGYAQLIVVSYFNIYYIIILSWTLYYFYQSFYALLTSSDLPWSRCGDWASECCSTNYTVKNETLALVKPINCTKNPAIPEAEYFSNQVLQITPGITDFGGINWPILGFLVFAWLVVIMVILKGAKSTGKAAYVTSTFPIVILTILVVKGLTLPGAKHGLRYYLEPRWEYLTKMSTWKNAGSQVIYSMVIFIGSNPSLGSYNKWSFNSLKWTARLAFLNSSASLLAGIAVFSILGNLSYRTGLEIEQVADKGPGLAFIAYPRALAQLKGSPIWSMLFFLMLFVLGVSSHCASSEGLIATLVDLFPSYFKPCKPLRRQTFVVGVCFTCFIAGLPMVLRSGIYFFNLMDTYGASGVSLLIIGFCEMTAIAWIYGMDPYYENLKIMCYTSRMEAGKTNKSDPYKFPWSIFRIIWKYISPAVLFILLIHNVFTISAPVYESVVTGKYEYSAFGVFIATFLVVSSILAIPIYAAYTLFTKKMNNQSVTWRTLIDPTYPNDHPYFILDTEGKN